MFTKETVKRANTQVTAGEAIYRMAGLSRNDAVDCIHSLIPGLDGGAPPHVNAIVQQTETSIILAAQSIMASPRAIEVLTAWNAEVSPDEDPLRFVRARLAEAPQ